LPCESNWVTPLVRGAIGIAGVCVGGSFPFLLNGRRFSKAHWKVLAAGDVLAVEAFSLIFDRTSDICKKITRR